MLFDTHTHADYSCDAEQTIGEAAAAAKARGIGTCIDTAGQPFTRKEPFFSQFQQLMEVTDILLVDVKLPQRPGAPGH